ncbi:uncharacterized protein ACA1_071200 [Acanthamoeba castellanii str. Neff]|uniref:Uncharacterized protein n=1 Tax=Acanthamoeba castellanii (strain ATCC 30010 / Neff) TaxID=1257118 RepID=L8HD84_ACACF|nr:uncharacterized protein ACA1_071200 [Acanthamoeba castellanii str. Neff]ELR23499.1 hypothetical protein ACA1_071200 [Acanthamoeba castellanii str. Neff]
MATTDADLLKMMDKLRKENNQLKLENSQLFKELDILNRKVRTKFGRPETTLHTLMEANDVAYTINSELSYSIPLSAFMDKFYKMYPESQARLEVYERRGRQCSFAVPLERGHLGGPHRAITRSGGRYEQLIRGWLGQLPPPPALLTAAQPELSVLPTTVTKQFARDLPSLIRINGKGVQGSSDNEKVVTAYNMLLEATNHNEMLTQKLMEVANQNLGILLYEDLVNHYSESGFLVKQTWYHYLDITFPLPSKHKLNQPSESEVMIYMLAIFELQSSDLENNPPLFVKSMLELAFALSDHTLSGSSPPAPPGFLSVPPADDKNERMVNAVFSTPTFNILPFLHSVDLDDEEPVASPPSTSPSYLPLPSEPSE